MKKYILALLCAICAATGTYAITYEEAFASIRDLPEMKGVELDQILGDNDIVNMGVTDAQIVVLDNQKGAYGETAFYGNTIYKIMGELPVSEMVQCRISGQNIFAIFATPISKGSNKILILADSAGPGFTAALIGKIDDSHLDALRQAILTQANNGTTVYLKAFTF